MTFDPRSALIGSQAGLMDNPFHILNNSLMNSSKVGLDAVKLLNAQKLYNEKAQALQDAHNAAQALLGSQKAQSTYAPLIDAARLKGLTNNTNLSQLYLEHPALRPGMNELQSYLALDNGSRAHMPSATNTTGALDQNSMSDPRLTNTGSAPVGVPLLNPGKNASLAKREAANYINANREKSNLALQNQYYLMQKNKHLANLGTSGVQNAKSAQIATSLYKMLPALANNYVQAKSGDRGFGENLMSALTGDKVGFQNTPAARSLKLLNTTIYNAAAQLARTEFGSRAGQFIDQIAKKYTVHPFDDQKTIDNKLHMLGLQLQKVRKARSSSFADTENTNTLPLATSGSLVGSLAPTHPLQYSLKRPPNTSYKIGQKVIMKDGSIKTIKGYYSNGDVEVD